MIRKAFVMQLHKGHKEEYQKRHNPIWPELEETLKEHGIVNYSIHFHEETHQLFAYLECKDEQLLASIADTEVCKKWWAHMKNIMDSNPDNSPIVKDLEEVFCL